MGDDKAYGPVEILIVTGLSGAGRTTAMHCLEDLGFFCVDNLPAKLIPTFANLCASTEGRVSRAALVIDVRERGFFEDVFTSLDELTARGFPWHILFLDANEQVLIRRFSATRRTHPLAGDGQSLEAGIAREREFIGRLREMASWILDTSQLTERELKEKLQEALMASSGAHWPLTVHVLSFGYKYGMPLDADIVFDVRFLPNPNYVPELKDLTGLDEKVRDFVFNKEETRGFMVEWIRFLDYVLPRYAKEGKVYLTIGIGCTGGRHRSVVMAEEIYRLLSEKNHATRVRHRDIEK